MWLFVLFVAVPLIEIALFIQVGGLIGLWPTLAIVVLTAILGTSLMRMQGAAAINRIRTSFNSLSNPTEPLAHGAMILFAGALMLTPGFFTDTLGFLLLIPAFRAAAFRWLKSRVTVVEFSNGQRPHADNGQRPPADDVVDGEFEEVPPKNISSRGPSGWTEH